MPHDAEPCTWTVPTFRQIARRGARHAVEAVVAPAVIVLVVSALSTTTAAIGAALAWVVGLVAWRWATGRAVSGMAILAAGRLASRTILAIAAGSTFLYFVQPTIGAIGLALTFLASVVVDRPLARRFARDFCDLPGRILHDRRVHRYFRRISLLWGAIGLAQAGAALWLLHTQSTNVYVVASTALSIGVTAALLATSVGWFRRTVVGVA